MQHVNLCQAVIALQRVAASSLLDDGANAQSNVNILLEMSSIIQSTPSSRFFPVIALHGKIDQWCVFMLSRSSTLA